jgi:hypothetical protein
MKIAIKYRKKFIRHVDFDNLEMAKRFTILSTDEIAKFYSKINLSFEYQEIIDAQNLTTKKKCSIITRMIKFINNCPNFRIVKLPHFKLGSFTELFQAEYKDDIIIISLNKNKYHRGSMVFHIKKY